MSDLIDRQAAIDALNKMKIYRPLDSDRYVISDCLNKIVNLPSAESEQMKKTKAIIATMLVMMLLVACRESTKVSYNISKQADNFNVVRRLTVINTRTDKMYLTNDRQDVHRRRNGWNRCPCRDR